MDVQGAEVHAIRGARETIAASPGLRMVVEMHPQCWPAFGVTADDCAASSTTRPDDATARGRGAALRPRRSRGCSNRSAAHRTPTFQGIAHDAPATASDQDALERIAAALPPGGRFAAVRRRLKPLFARWLASRRRAALELPGGEVYSIDPAFRHITWNPIEHEAFRAAVRPGDVVLEAGANVGAYTLLFGNGWEPPAGSSRSSRIQPPAPGCAARRAEQPRPMREPWPAAVTDGAHRPCSSPSADRRASAARAAGEAIGVGEVRDAE